MDEHTEYCCPGLSVLWAKVKDDDRLYMKLFEASDQRVVVAMMEADKAMQTALAVTKEAAEKAAVATEKRFDEVSEKLDTLRESLSTQITTATANSASATGRTGGINALWGYLVGALGAGGMIVGIIMAFSQ